MSAGKFTAGPWCVVRAPQRRDYGGGIVHHEVHVSVGDKANAGNTLAIACMGGDGALHSSLDEVMANARLIAASPTMFDALERCFFALGRIGANELDGPYRAEWEAARAALALAKDGTP